MSNNDFSGSLESKKLNPFLNAASNNLNNIFFIKSKNFDEKEEIKNEDKNLFEKKEEEDEEKKIKIIHIDEYFIYTNEKIVSKSKKLEELKKNIEIKFGLHNENLQIFTLDEKSIFHELKDENEYIKIYANIKELYLKNEKINIIEEQNNYDFVLHSNLKNKENYKELMACNICFQKFNTYICPNCQKKICEDCFFKIGYYLFNYLTCPLCKVQSEKKLYIFNDGKILLNDSITKLKQLEKISKICKIHNEDCYYYDFITKKLYCQKCYDEIEESNSKTNHKFIILKYYQNLIKQNELLDIIYKDEVQEKCFLNIECIKESKTKIIIFLNDLIEKVKKCSEDYIKDLTKISNEIKYSKVNNFSDKLFEYFNNIEINTISCKASNDVIQKIYKFNLKKYYNDIIISKKYYYKYPDIEIDKLAKDFDEKLKEGILFIKQFKYIGSFLKYSEIDCRIFGEEKGLSYNFEGYFNEDGEKIGKGKLNDFKTQTKYIGNYLKNRFNGYGKYYLKDNLIYEGQFKEGIYQGLGKDYKGSNVKYIGEFSNKKEKDMALN